MESVQVDSTLERVSDFAGRTVYLIAHTAHQGKGAERQRIRETFLGKIEVQSLRQLALCGAGGGQGRYNVRWAEVKNGPFDKLTGLHQSLSCIGREDTVKQIYKQYYCMTKNELARHLRQCNSSSLKRQSSGRVFFDYARVVRRHDGNRKIPFTGQSPLRCQLKALKARRRARKAI